MSSMTAHDIHRLIDGLSKTALNGLHGKDFLLTWDKSREELEAILQVAAIMRTLRQSNISARAWDSGLAVSQFRRQLHFGIGDHRAAGIGDNPG
jgi:hypothetical protein